MRAIGVASVRPRARDFHDGSCLFLALLGDLCGFNFLLFVLFAVVEYRPVPIDQVRPNLRFRVCASNGEVVGSDLVPIRGVLRPNNGDALLNLVMNFPLLCNRNNGIGTSVFALRHTRVRNAQDGVRQPSNVGGRVIPTFKVPRDDNHRYGGERCVPRHVLWDFRVAP